MALKNAHNGCTNLNCPYSFELLQVPISTSFGAALGFSSPSLEPENKPQFLMAKERSSPLMIATFSSVLVMLLATAALELELDTATGTLNVTKMSDFTWGRRKFAR